MKEVDNVNYNREEVMKELKSCGYSFAANYFMSCIDFFRYSYKNEFIQIQWLAKLYDQSEEKDLPTFQRKMNCLKRILQHDGLIFACDILRNSRLSTMDQTKVRELSRQIQNHQLPIYEIREDYQPQHIGACLYSFGNLNLNIGKLVENILEGNHAFMKMQVDALGAYWHMATPMRLGLRYPHDDEFAIFLEFQMGRYTCVHGFSLLGKAYLNYEKKITAYVLKVHEFLPYFYDRRSYESFIHYWNCSLFYF